MAKKKTIQRKTESKQTAAGSPAAKGDRLDFPVVGIGASAGGLEALEELFDHMPTNTGMAFVVLTHQRRGHTSLLPELLMRETQMPVVQVTDGMRLQPNRFHVSPPGEHLSLHDGAFHLVPLKPSEAARLPIDHFFRSLAGDQQERAIGIVLSGTGSDGTIGLKTIKAASGMAMVQTPQSAKFVGMPSSAIATGLADYVLPPAEMPDQLVAYAKGAYLRRPAVAGKELPISDETMQKIFRSLRARTGHDFSAYKINTIGRRIQRRMNVHQIDQPEQYARYLQENPHENDMLFKELLISVTSFFRDPPAWEALCEGPLTELIQSRPDDYTLRAWVPGCATGEEVYTLAIVLRECKEESLPLLDAQIFGTDLDRSAINVARLGQYADGIAADVLPKRLERYLRHEDSTYRVRQEIREMTIFAPQNVVADPPFTNLDIICCRNLLIYLNSDLQKRLMPIFHYALRPGGLLFLGPSEGIGSSSDCFETLSKQWKIYRRLESSPAHPIDLPAVRSRRDVGTKPAARAGDGAERVSATQPSAAPSIDRLIERVLLARHCPPSVVVDEHGNIVCIVGRTGEYLEPAEGQPPRMNALDMAREGLRTELAIAIRQAASEDKETVRAHVRVKTNGDYSHVNLSVCKIRDPEAIQGLLLVTFEPSPPPDGSPRGEQTPPRDSAADTDRGERWQREIQTLRQSYRDTQEKLETANEELKSTNEELQSTNEELQSANEELETSKEEMQSLNEELTTVNTELQSKVDELSHANDDMQNLLNSTEVATVFLDTELGIKRFTESVKELIKLRQTDRGRPLGELATNLREGDLEAECRQVLKTFSPVRREVVSKDDRWYIMRILPYRTIRNVIDGLVITFVPMDELKKAESDAGLRYYFKCLFETVRHPLIVLDEDLRIVSVNRRFRQTFHLSSENPNGSLLYEISEQEWDIPELRELLEDILPSDAFFDDFKVDHDFRKLGRRVFLLNARRVKQEAALPGLILLAMEDVTKSYENKEQ